MPAYRYLIAELFTGTPLAEVPFESISFEHVLNAPGSFEATLKLTQPPAIHTALAGLLPASIGQIAIHVERDGVIIWSGIPWTISSDFAADSMTVRGEGWHSYLRRRVLRETKTYTQRDQTTGIAVDLINWALTHYGPGTAPAISTSSVAPTGVLRDRTYAAFERKNIGEAIEQLAAVQDGFDFRYESAWVGDVLSTRFLTTYPNRGRQTNLVFDLAKAASTVRVDVDATALATHVDAIGAGEGDIGLLATVTNTALIGTYPILDDVISHTDISVFATLDAHARRQLTRDQAPVILPTLRVEPGVEPTLGSYTCGDIVRVIGNAGLGTIDQQVRITHIRVTVDESGAETAELAFASLTAY